MIKSKFNFNKKCRKWFKIFKIGLLNRRKLNLKGESLIMNKEELIYEIEKYRKKMVNLSLKYTLHCEEIVSVSKHLDHLLNLYDQSKHLKERKTAT